MKNFTKPKRHQPILRFSPTAWAKLLFLRDAGDTEVCGFGIAAADDLLFVEDIVLVNQVCTWITAELDDASVADFFDAQVDEGRTPEQFARIFIHTHPGSSPEPSGTDEDTFARVFGRSDWAVMFILARQGSCYARLRYNMGPGADIEVPVEVQYGRPFGPSDEELWSEEHASNVRKPEPVVTKRRQPPADDPHPDTVEAWWRDAWDDYADFDLSERRFQHEYL